jgi:hypothetical protein
MALGLSAISLWAISLPAQARLACGEMLMPAAELKQVSRGLSSFHSGLDLMAPYGSPVRAAAAGEVVFVGSYFGYGNMVDIRHFDGVITRYGHLSAFAPKLAVGIPVESGELLGKVGTSGHAHGAHLHFEVRLNGRPIDPKPMLSLAACSFTAPAPTEAIEQAQAASPRPRRRP